MSGVPPTTRAHAPFALFNRTVNPLVAGLLQSPVHAALSRQLVLITVTGRKTGRAYRFPVLYRRDGDRVVIPIGWPERKRWWRNLRTAAPVELRLRGRRRTGSAVAEGDETSGVRVVVTLDPG